MKNKYLFGSKMLKMSNPRDEDYIEFVTGPGKNIQDRTQRSIPFYKKMINLFILGQTDENDMYNACFLYQNSAPFFNDENYPFNFFNILEHKRVWIEQLKAYMNSERAEKGATKTDILPKQLYHILYQYHMIKENTHWISDEARVDVQKIHDREMPSSYFYELRDKINSLEADE